VIYGSRSSGFLYLSPYLIGLAVFTLFPFVSSLLLSFSDYRLQDAVGAAQFIGLENYEAMLHDRTFGKSLVVTLVYVFLTVPLKLAFALFIAFVLNFRLRAIGAFRTAYYLPSILGGSVAIAVVWRYVFAGDGLLNQAFALLGAEPINWLGEPAYAMGSIVLLRLWQFGSAMVIFLAGLQGIPNDLYEEFNGPYVITGGGPLKSTYLLPLMIYDEAFKYFEVGYASALSWCLFVLVAIFTAMAFRSSKYWVFYAQEKGQGDNQGDKA
jgi:oligogalacturonide transport system permease protein